ncbi:MAG: hypothetical protein KBD15_02700 [Candidatus Magasanikbacteria bacterium]|nr:hypothetical protein [Candidatus Magasanikbacteria bacterium]
MNHIGSILHTHTPFEDDDAEKKATPPIPFWQPHEPTAQLGETPEATSSVISPSDPHQSPFITPSSQRETPVPIDIGQIKNQIAHIREALVHMESLLQGVSAPATVPNKSMLHSPSFASKEQELEGVFNGTSMVASNGKEYPIPPNYASKSKLVEGDIMKMTITENGVFRFKQIGPIGRKYIRGQVFLDATKHEWTVLAEGRMYRVLTAAITFHKASAGSTVVIIVPEDGESAWAAIEHLGS